MKQYAEEQGATSQKLLGAMQLASSVSAAFTLNLLLRRGKYQHAPVSGFSVFICAANARITLRCLPKRIN